MRAHELVVIVVHFQIGLELNWNVGTISNGKHDPRVDLFFKQKKHEFSIRRIVYNFHDESAPTPALAPRPA